MVERGAIPVGVRKLLLDLTLSTEALEALVVLRGDPARLWTLPELASACRLPSAAAAGALSLLAAGGLVDAGRSGFVYRATTRETGEAVEDLLRIYETDRALVLRLMSEHAIVRVRRSMALAFADAFVLDDDRGTGGKHG
jgi:hypothetical protein